MSAIPEPEFQRNARCPCGSGKRFKPCRGAFANAAPISVDEAAIGTAVDERLA